MYGFLLDGSDVEPLNVEPDEVEPVFLLAVLEEEDNEEVELLEVEPVFLLTELAEEDDVELLEELPGPPLAAEEDDDKEDEDDEDEDDEDEDTALEVVWFDAVDEEDEEDEEEAELAVGQVGNDLKKVLLLPVSHQEPELIALRLIASARKPSSDETVGRAVAVEAESAKMATVICLETFILPQVLH